MSLYTSDGCYYMGMDEATIIRLRTELGQTSVFVDKETYDTIIASQQSH